MSMQGSRARIASLTKDLVGRWNETRNYWRDEKATEFEQEYIRELTASVNSAVTALEKLDLLLNRIHNDCE